MSDIDNDTDPHVSVTSSGIPIRNLWHMLLYAWSEIQWLGQWRAKAEDAPTLDALLATILADLVQQRMRIGLGRDYTAQESLLRGLRGRVQFAESLKRLAFEHGQAHCRYQTFSLNVPKNQIVRSTLARLAQIGQFGPDRFLNELLRHRLRRLVLDLDAVDFIELKRDVIRREQLLRHDADYRLMLAICYLVRQREMPTESQGDENLPHLHRDDMTLWRVFEKFVANFLRLRLSGWKVIAQAPWHWHASAHSEFLPAMKPDIVLQHLATGVMIVIDTKFTASSLVTGQWGTSTFNRDHLFQMYAYLRSHEHLSNEHRSSAGVLLYPTVRRELTETVHLQGHDVRWETVDLTRPWHEIEERLLSLEERKPRQIMNHDQRDLFIAK